MSFTCGTLNTSKREDAAAYVGVVAFPSHGALAVSHGAAVSDGRSDLSSVSGETAHEFVSPQSVEDAPERLQSIPHVHSAARFLDRCPRCNTTQRRRRPGTIPR